MRISLRFLLVLLLIFYSCSKDEGDVPTEPKEVKEFELSNKIIGRWDVDHNLDNAQASTNKQSEPVCYMFSLVFEADNTFQINYRNGTLEGNYEVISEKEIRLISEGNISEIRFVNGGLSFYIFLESICSLQLNCFHDPDYSRGECSSFLKCNDQKIWKKVEDSTITYVKFFDHFEGTWYREFKIGNNQTCYSVESNQLEEGTMVLTKNQINKLGFIYERNGKTDIYTYSLNNQGILNLKIENETETINITYLPADQAELDNVINLPECGAKTYIPDNGFEQFLIDSGYDHILDDYVLTENIFYVEYLYMEDYYYGSFSDMTGLEDFDNLKFLQILGWHSMNLKKIDLSGNDKLEGIYLEIPSLESIDLSQNQLLDYVFIQDAKLETIDFSNNPLLRSFEFNGGSFKTIDLSPNKNLEGFQINDNPLEYIILGENNKLKEIRIYGYSGLPGDSPKISLSNVDVSQLPNLQLLHLTNTNIETIYLLKNLELYDLVLFNNELDNLDISTNEKLGEFDATENPNLTCIQIGEVHLEQITEFPISWQKDESTEFSLNCTE